MLSRILTRKRIYIVSLTYIILGAYCYLNVLPFSEHLTFFESTMLTSTANITIGGIYMMMIFPLISTFLLSDIFLEDEKLNIKYLWYTKYGVVKYHIINISSIFIIVFLITFLCFGFNFLLAYISFGNLNVSSYSLFTDFKLESYAHEITNFDLLLKSPLNFFILKNAYISLYGALFAIFAYLISTFIKNKYIITLLPVLIYNGVGLIVSVIGRPGNSLYNLLNPNFSVVIRNPELINIYAIILIFINVCLYFVLIIKEKEYV